MELFDAIRLRHSYRGPFRDLPVPREDLELIVEAGDQGSLRPERPDHDLRHRG